MDFPYYSAVSQKSKDRTVHLTLHPSPTPQIDTEWFAFGLGQRLADHMPLLGTPVPAGLNSYYFHYQTPIALQKDTSVH